MKEPKRTVGLRQSAMAFRFLQCRREPRVTPSELKFRYSPTILTLFKTLFPHSHFETESMLPLKRSHSHTILLIQIGLTLPFLALAQQCTPTPSLFKPLIIISFLKGLRPFTLTHCSRISPFRVSEWVSLETPPSLIILLRLIIPLGLLFPFYAL